MKNGGRPAAKYPPLPLYSLPCPIMTHLPGSGMRTKTLSLTGYPKLLPNSKTASVVGHWPFAVVEKLIRLSQNFAEGLNSGFDLFK